MPYVTVAPQHATQLSRSIMRLLRPSHLRAENWTDCYCSVITHPMTGEAALALPDMETVPLHTEADGAELSELLSVFVADGALTQQEANGISAAVQANAGQKVLVAQFIPLSWVSNVFNRQQMENAGWFLPTAP